MLQAIHLLVYQLAPAENLDMLGGLPLDRDPSIRSRLQFPT